MSNMISFEIKKFFHRKKNIFIIMIFIALSIGFIMINSSLENQYKKSEISSIDYSIESLKKDIPDTKDTLKQYPGNKNLEVLLETQEKEIKIYEKQKEAYINKDYSTYLKCKIQLDKDEVNGIENNTIVAPADNIENLKNNIKMNSLLLEKKIVPIFTGVSMEGYNFFRIFLNSPFSILIAIVVIILCADVVSSEFDSNTYKLLFTQPVSKSKILISKLLAMIILSVFILLFVLTIFFISLGIINGFGSSEYPIQYFKNNVIQYIGIGKFIMLEITMLVCMIIFMASLSVFMSSLFKNTSMSMAVSIIISIALYMITTKGMLKSIASLNPFAYFDISSVLQGTASTIYSNNNVDFYHGILTLSIFSIILIFTNFMCFNKHTWAKFNTNSTNLLSR
ncbi:ABC transporter permease subunit [Inconstantimicrobium porci]|uniref:ABC transporter permease subunit n=1 Tax=Inconstantimicrobium porci TaxID=2652291 RepID=A0A7X2T0P2_9CLOT|nr:ABC transporter permease subunit [Inconstantimicrobium porci]MDD6771803.1 ABC transporter permease subunit [Inconstantimicrobium porci]MSR90360.1 ABC transporter permease subunit [Inconstantimicrobium porci]